jgi:hypothetical protein
VTLLTAFFSKYSQEPERCEEKFINETRTSFMGCSDFLFV